MLWVSSNPKHVKIQILIKYGYYSYSHRKNWWYFTSRSLFKKVSWESILWYNVRDNLFAPITIRTANYTKDWQLRPYYFIVRWFPVFRKILIWIRTILRTRHAVSVKNIALRASIVIGHFSVTQVLPYLNPKNHEYRTVLRHSLNRMWSHFNYFMAHKGDVGHRTVPCYKHNMSFEEFALSPEMKNYQLGAVGNDLSIYKHIGITEHLDLFTREIGLIKDNETTPKVNCFYQEMPPLDKEFIVQFETFHALDYELYNCVMAQKIP